MQSSPPISPGCEDQQIHSMRMELNDEFKKPIPPHSPIRPQDFPLYASGNPYHLLPGGSAFHRPLDATGKPIPVIYDVNKTLFKNTFFFKISHIIFVIFVTILCVYY